MSDVPEGYRMSEMGVIPEEWEVKKLGECLLKKPEYGINAAAVPYSDNLPVYIRITDISDDGKFLPAGKTSVNNIDSNKFQLEKDDIVFARTGASTGKTYLYNSNDGKLVFAGFLIRVRVNPNKLIASYLKSYTETGTYWNWVKIMSMRSGQPGINGNEYAQLQIPLPSLPEQQAIASALSDVDALITALEQLITKKRNIKQGAMQQLLTGKKRLPGFGGEWEVKTLENVCAKNGLVRGPFGGTLKKEFFVRNGLKVYEQKNAIYRNLNLGNYFIDKNKFNELKRFEVKKGDFIVSCSGTIGKIYQIPKCAECGIINQALLKIKTDDDIIHDRFFFYYFDWEKFQEEIIDNTQGGAMQNLVGMNIFRNTQILLPPLPEQQAIAQILSDMDTEIEALEQKRDKYRTIKQGMMQELLTGKTRLAKEDKT